MDLPNRKRDKTRAEVVAKFKACILQQPELLARALSGWRECSAMAAFGVMNLQSNPYRGFRFPRAIIQHAVWLYHCFSVSLRDVELILAERGIVVSYESIREWGLRFGQMSAAALKRRRPKPGDKWHLDEVFIRIRARFIICGAQSIRTATFSTSWCRAGEIPMPQSGSFANC
jgi:putative transposase